MKVVIKDNFDSTMYAFERKVQAALNQLAKESADKVQEGLESGVYGLGEDTGSTAASIYSVQIQQGGAKSDYGDAAQKFSELYARRYSTAHWEERLLDSIKVESSRDVKRAGFGSCSKILWFWEVGHTNKFTNMFEHIPILANHVAETKRKIPRRMRGLLRKSCHQGS